MTLEWRGTKYKNPNHTQERLSETHFPLYSLVISKLHDNYLPRGSQTSGLEALSSKPLRLETVKSQKYFLHNHKDLSKASSIVYILLIPSLGVLSVWQAPGPIRDPALVCLGKGKVCFSLYLQVTAHH